MIMLFICSKSLLRHVEKSIFQRLFTNGLEHQRWQAAVKKGEAEKDDPEASKLLIVSPCVDLYTQYTIWTLYLNKP